MSLEAIKKQLGSVVESIAPKLLPIVEMNIVPDAVVRLGIRLMLADRLKIEKTFDLEEKQKRKQAFVNNLKKSPICINTVDANKQHYEVPSDFYLLSLGPNLKYSSGLWPKGVNTLEESEVTMLETYCERANLGNNQTILDLGCGWGSCSLYVAKKYPRSKVYGLSNSRTQKEFIESRCKERGITNLEIVTTDIGNESSNPFSETKFDRVLSIEMFEHMKNYERLLKRVSNWMKPGATLFVHIFAHRDLAYHFDQGWMAENFFTGGLMPSQDLLLYFQQDLNLVNSWNVNGTHYGKTSEAWLAKMDENKDEIFQLFRKVYGSDKDATKWIVNWRLFFLACAELFNYENGNQWHVAHYLFEKKSIE